MLPPATGAWSQPLRVKNPRPCSHSTSAQDADHRTLPLIDRKAELKKIVRRSGRVRCAQHIEEHGKALFRHIERLELEGIVAKCASSIYRAGRTRDWLKVKTGRRPL